MAVRNQHCNNVFSQDFGIILELVCTVAHINCNILHHNEPNGQLNKFANQLGYR